MTDAIRTLMLFAAVHLAALTFGAWAVMGPDAALLLAWLALMLTVLSLPLARWLFSVVYRRWLWDHWHKNYCRVIRVTSWRSALLESRNGRERRHMTACFWGLD